MPDLEEPFVLFKKNAREAVGVACTEWKGESRVDLRIYVQAIGEEELVPTKKGISIPLELFPEVLEGVRRLGDVMSSDKVVAVISRSVNSQIRVGANTFHGHHLVYVRLFNREEPSEPESWKATNKGVSIRVDLYPRLLKALEDAMKMIGGK